MRSPACTVWFATRFCYLYGFCEGGGSHVLYSAWVSHAVSQKQDHNGKD